MSRQADRNGNILEELARLDEKFAKISVNDPNAPVPDGRYVADLDGVQLKRAGSGAPMLEWTFTIAADGPHQGRKVWLHRIINDKTLKWVKEDLAVCGVTIERISVLAAPETPLPGLAGAKLDITIKTKGEHRNVYLNRRLDTPADASNVFGGDEQDFQA